MTSDPVLPLLAERKNLITVRALADKRMIAAPPGSVERVRAESEFDSLGDRIDELEDTIAGTQATSLAGVVGKLDLIAGNFIPADPGTLDVEERMVRAAYLDLQSLAAVAP